METMPRPRDNARRGLVAKPPTLLNGINPATGGKGRFSRR